MKKRNLFIVSILCLLFSFAQAQSPQAVNFLPRLPDYYPQHFVVDNNYLWFGGSNALIKFDTQNSTQTLYKPENSNMKGGLITGVTTKQNGIIYGTTYANGIFSFDGTHFQNYDTLASGKIMKGCQEAVATDSGDIIILAALQTQGLASSSLSLVKFDGTSLSELPIPSQNIDNHFVADKNNLLFIYGYQPGTNIKKTYFHNGTNWDSVSTLSGDFRLMVDINKEAWLVPSYFTSTTNTYFFYKWSGTNWLANVVSFSNPINAVVKDITVDSTNTFWFCSEDRVIKKTSNGLFAINTPTVPVNINNYFNSFSSFMVMPNGDFWCKFSYWSNTKSENKLWHYNNLTNWQAIDVYSDFDADIYKIQVDKWDRKWAVSPQGYYLLVGGIWQKIPMPPNFKPNANVTYDINQDFDVNGNLVCILHDLNGNSNIFKYDGLSWTLITSNYPSAINMAIDNLGRIMVADFQINYFDGNTWIMDTSMFSNSCINTFVDANNTFWVTTTFGDLYKFNGTSFNYFASTNSGWLIHTNTDKMGNTWLIPDGNTTLFRLNGTTLTQYSAANIPLPSTPQSPLYIYSGSADLTGNIWITTNKGLAKFDGTSWVIYNINNADFMGINSYLSIDNSNNLWLNDAAGVTVFNESGLQANFTQNISPSFKGAFYYDANSNGQKDASEYALSNQKVFILPDSTARISNGLGQYQFIPNAGSYNLSALLYLNWQQTSTPVNYTVAATPQGVDSLDFGIKASTNIDSLELHIFGGNSRCDWLNNYFISYQNKGNTPLSGDILFTMDSLETFSSSYPNADSLSPFVYSWHFSNLMPFQSQNISVTVQSPNWQAMGQTINGNVHAIGTNFNVTALYSDILTCAYDPNDKASKPLGEHYLHQIKPDCPLEYLIRFQNTGNDVAFNIAVEDTISPYLDMNTFELLGASHFVETKYAQNGAVRFEFPLIMLPDSNQNEALSHGFVAYRIKPKANVPLPAVIENTAFIYFDQNPAVVTNTSRDTMTQFYTGINAPTPQNALLISPNPFDNQTIVTYPNPFGEGYEVLIYDLSGKLLVRKMDNTGRFSIEKGNLQSGMYLLKVRGKKEMSAKLVVE